MYLGNHCFYFLWYFIICQHATKFLVISSLPFNIILKPYLHLSLLVPGLYIQPMHSSNVLHLFFLFNFHCPFLIQAIILFLNPPHWLFYVLSFFLTHCILYSSDRLMFPKDYIDYNSTFVWAEKKLTFFFFLVLCVRQNILQKRNWVWEVKQSAQGHTGSGRIRFKPCSSDSKVSVLPTNHVDSFSRLSKLSVLNTQAV